MRATRLIYVENDPALRGIMTRAFEASSGIELLLSTGTAADAMAFDRLGHVDAALLDLALGAGSMSGLDLGNDLIEGERGLEKSVAGECHQTESIGPARFHEIQRRPTRLL